jgi:F-type H+-transporting ATPase subunit epsilon
VTAKEKKVHLRVITPEAVKYDEKADMVIFRAITGDMGIQPGHMSCSALLDYGVMRIMEESNERRIGIYGGLAQLQDNVLTVLANSAQWPEEVDRAEAQAGYKQAEERARSPEALVGAEKERNQALLKQSQVQLLISENVSQGSSWD